MVPFVSSGTISYSHSIVTKDVSCIVSEIKGIIGRKLWFFILPLHLTPQLGGPIVIVPFGAEILEWCGYPTVKKIQQFCFYTIPACGRRTDRKTSCDIIYSPRYAWHHAVTTDGNPTTWQRRRQLQRSRDESIDANITLPAQARSWLSTTSLSPFASCSASCLRAIQVLFCLLRDLSWRLSDVSLVDMIN